MHTHVKLGVEPRLGLMSCCVAVAVAGQGSRTPCSLVGVIKRAAQSSASQQCCKLSLTAIRLFHFAHCLCHAVRCGAVLWVCITFARAGEVRWVPSLSSLGLCRLGP